MNNPGQAGKKIRVLVVDDSRYMRFVLSKALNDAPGIEVAGEARDGLSAISEFEKIKPDVVTLDVEMGAIDGLQTLGELMKRGGAKVIMVSSHTGEGSDATLKALELGAIDFVQKPSGSDSLTLDTVKHEIVDKVRIAARASSTIETAVEPPGQIAVKKFSSTAFTKLRKVVIIGSSTGGPRALAKLLPGLPADAPAGYVVVQHMPPNFTASLASRINATSSIEVREAADGDVISPGVALIAPGDRHLVVQAGGVLRVIDGDKVNNVRPSVDVTMTSAAPLFREMLIGVILTGMGRDGTDGGARVREHGGTMIAQEPSSCVVDGMPSSLVDAGYADKVVHIDNIANELSRAARDD